MADAVRYPSGGDRVCPAVALGWQMAVLYHSPVHRARRITGSAAGAMALSGTEPHPAGELPAAPAVT